MATRVQPAMPADSGETLTERAVAILRRDIVSGALAPAERLGVRDLVARLGIGATPIREALSRLAAQDLVEANGRRGFRVAAIGRSDLEDLTRLRTLVEVAALQQAMARGDDVWEAGIVASLHRLQQAGGRGSRRARDNAAESDALHKEFHDALIAA
ncbi:MAG: GntR family transcriptional regulator, partial [Alphaproteobacteria bacterium]|nr:GntR family transcriptional regulator [Alphaproteobacteria bacterium]